MLISLCPPPSPSYPTPITAIACPSIGDAVEISLKITIGGNESYSGDGIHIVQKIVLEIALDSNANP